MARAQAKIHCDVMVCGATPKGKALRRDGARPGDSLWVSGRLGRPWDRKIRPRLDLAPALRGRASCLHRHQRRAGARSAPHVRRLGRRGGTGSCSDRAAAPRSIAPCMAATIMSCCLRFPGRAKGPPTGIDTHRQDCAWPRGSAKPGRSAAGAQRLRSLRNRQHVVGQGREVRLAEIIERAAFGTRE